jgi:hypothetical protein
VPLRIGVVGGPWCRGVRGRVFIVTVLVRLGYTIVFVVFDVAGGSLIVGGVVVTGFDK